MINIEQAKSLSGNIIIRITNQSIDAIFSKKIVTNTGEEKTLSINVDADEDDDRKSTLFVETAIVTFVGRDIIGIEKDDIAIISYELINDKSKLIYSSEEEGLYYCITPVTKYHKQENIAFGNQKMPVSQLVWDKGEVDELSPLIGIIRNGELFANAPYVFLTDISEEPVYGNEELISAKIFGASETSKEKYSFNEGNEIVVRELDTFEINIDDKKIICCNDIDLLLCND